MGDDNEQFEQIDREVSLIYQDMMLFLKDEYREVKVMDHKYVLRATSGGRVRGLYSDIYRAMKAYLDHNLQPGVLSQMVEEARTKIQKLRTEPNKKTTMLALSEEGFADSDPSRPAEFTQAELEPLQERCSRFWNGQLDVYNQVRSRIARQFNVPAQVITDAFLRTTSAEQVYELVRQAAYSRTNLMHHSPIESDDDGDDSEEDYIPVIKNEDIAALKSLLPSFTDDELKHALIAANGNVELAADNLLRN
jgi:hypothetical protein